MRKKTYINILAILIAFVFLLGSCKKDEQVKLSPSLVTWQISKITSNSATASGYVIAEGGGFTERGICWNTTPSPTTADKKAVVTKVDGAVFVASMTDLTYATKYYVRAYAVSEGSTIYGKDTSFTTMPVLPTVTTTAVTAITGITATSGGNVTNNGGAAITARGVCWGTKTSPTIADKVTKDGAGSGAFVSNLTGLNGLTKYYARAYATNSVGTSYGPEVNFTTLIADITWYVPGNQQGWDPATASSISNTLENPNTVTGYVWLDGEFKFTADRNWNVGYGAGAVAGTLSSTGGNLSAPKGYYLITVDFAKMTYTLLLTDWGVIGDGTANGWNDPDQKMTYGAASGTWVANLPLTAAFIKFRANGNWNLNYGDTGANGSLEAGGDNIAVKTAGDYTITLDLSKPNKYTYNLHSWGLIGSATPTAWDSDTNFKIVNGKLTLTIALIVGEIKFRADDNWNLNYGDTKADKILDAGGDNIAIATAGNYTITLDLANLTYTIVKN
jgi:hypothetical protein